MHSSLKVSLKTDFLKCWWVGCSKKNCNIFCFQWYYLTELNFNTFNFWITELFLKTFKLYDDIWMIWQQMDNLNSALENVTKFQYLNTPLLEHWQHFIWVIWFLIFCCKCWCNCFKLSEYPLAALLDKKWIL